MRFSGREAPEAPEPNRAVASDGEVLPELVGSSDSESEHQAVSRPSPLTSSDSEDERPKGSRARQPSAAGCQCDCVEPVRAIKKSYRNVGKKEKQEELFPALQKEIAAKRAEL